MNGFAPTKTIRRVTSFGDLLAASNLSSADLTAAVAAKHEVKIVAEDADDYDSDGSSTFVGTDTDSLDTNFNTNFSILPYLPDSEVDDLSSDEASESKLHAGHIPGGRTCKQHGPPHRHAIFGPHLIANGSKDRLPPAFKYAYEFEPTVETDPEGAFRVLEGGDAGDEDAALALEDGPSDRDEDEMPKMLCTLHGFPHDLRSPAISRYARRRDLRGRLQRAFTRVRAKCCCLRAQEMF